MRLDAYVAKIWPEQSRSTWHTLIEAGHVRVNGIVQTVPKYIIDDQNDQVEVVHPNVPDHSDKTLPILYEDDDVIVINKPVGVLTHAKGAVNEEFTVADFVRSKTTYKSDTNRPGIIHRLDRATSGVIVCAKHDEVASLLQKQFSQRTLKKTYMAVLSSQPKDQKAILQLPIARNPNAPSTFRVDSNGKHAETAYDIKEYGLNRCLVELRPLTGRTHQLRVHMAYINSPILGDPVYGDTKADRMYLHAQSIELTLPGGKRTTFNAPLPISFQESATK